MGDNDKTKAYVKAALGLVLAGAFLWIHSGAAAKKCEEKC